MMDVVVTTGAIKTYRAADKQLLPATNKPTSSFYRLDAVNSARALKGKRYR